MIPCFTLSGEGQHHSLQLAVIENTPRLEIAIRLSSVWRVSSFSLWGGGIVVLPRTLQGPLSRFFYCRFTVARPLCWGLAEPVEEEVSRLFWPGTGGVLLRLLNPLWPSTCCVNGGIFIPGVGG